MFPVILAQDAPTPQELEELRLSYKAAWAAESYWEHVRKGGPLSVWLQVLMLVAFVVAVVLAWRRSRSSAPYFVALLPFALGAVAMWAQMMALNELVQGGWANTDVISQQLTIMPLPFYVGTGLSVALLMVVAMLRQARRPLAAP